ncbi:MAG: metallophosphoesterase [Acidobacteria bacterium]|nr:metallophosphoesterase [Acidobacteriota bacterium]
MGFRFNILFFLILFNALPIFALVRSVRVWAAPERRRRILWCSLAIILLINLPISIFWYRSIYNNLYLFPATFLRFSFYPTVAWQSSAVLFTLLAGPVFLVWAAVLAIRLAAKALRAPTADPRTAAPLSHSEATPPSSSSAFGSPLTHRVLSRRALLTGGPGLIVPAMTLGLSAKMFLDDEVDISREMTIPMPHLPRSLDGMTIVQLSDLHAGPYIRRKEIAYWVHLANELKPDLVVLTGDMIDRNMDSLPDLLEGLRGLRPSLGQAPGLGAPQGAPPLGVPPLGVIAVLGNHDLSSDPSSTRGNLQGGERIAQAMQSIGIRTLRNEVLHIGASGPDLSNDLSRGQDRLAVLGMDWVRRRDGDNFFAYHGTETYEKLRQLTAQVQPETPTLLLAHHPDTFAEIKAAALAKEFSIGLTLSGHTHGGGQVVFFQWAGKSVGLTSVQFQYVSGLFQEAGCHLYVNRGLGYFGVPIRINCPPEISRFKLVRA